MLVGLHERGFTDLVAAHVDVWRYPGPENQRPSELATQTRMTKQALNYLLGQLEHLGYLTRETDSNDQRFKRVRLTPRGHAATRAIYEIVQEVETEWKRQLGPRKFGQLRRLLTQLYAITTPSACSSSIELRQGSFAPGSEASPSASAGQPPSRNTEAT